MASGEMTTRLRMSKYLMEFFPIKHRCDALSAAVFTRGIQSLDGGNEVEALEQVVY